MSIRSISAAIMAAACNLFLVLPATAAVNMPAGRIAITHDGNQHDLDDIGALAMNCALIKAAGLQNRLVHVDYSNHLGDNSTTQSNSMITSANGGISRFGLDGSRFFNDQTALTAAIANFKREAEKSTAADPLWFICSGPMETAWRCINAVTASKRQYIHCISHSTWNEIHADTTQMTHTWTKMKTDFTTVIFHDIIDQNSSDGDNDWNTPLSKWYWLRDASDPNLAWVYTRNQFSTKFDPSDAGMTYWLMSGGPNGGDERSGWPEAKALLLNPVTGGNQAPVANAGADRAITLPGAASLDGTVTDDGLPSGALTQTWTKVSGPGTVSFANASAVDTTATFSVAGSYVLRLTASDGALSANDTVTVTVASPTANLPPAVAISTPVTGATFAAPANIAAAAIATDSDGTVSKVEFLVDGVLRHTENLAPYDFAWNAVPVGTYQLTARATDNMGAITTSVAVTVTVSSTVTNSAPIVDAGPNRTITLPATASLDGTVTDDGKPTPINLTQTWTKVSGPGTVTFANAAAVDTTASFSVAGSYVLRLTASDGELSANDTVSVTVSDASGGNAIITLTDDCYLENGTLKNDTYLKVEVGTRTRVAYLRFNVSGLGGIAPANASLTLKVNGDAGSGTVRVNQGSHSTWSETTLTSANAPTVGTQLAAITGTFALNNTVVINLAPIITVDGNYTIILRLDAGGNDVWFGSDEGTAKPVLSINVTPSGSG